MAKNKGARGSYLAGGAMAAAAVKKWLSLLIGGFLTAFFGLGLLLILTDSGYLDGDDLGVCLGVLIPSVLLLLLGIRQARRMDLARRYDSALCALRGAAVPLSALAELPFAMQKAAALWRPCPLAPGAGSCLTASGCLTRIW